MSIDQDGGRDNSHDAIDLLTSDHKKVKGLFEKFEAIKDTASPEKKGALVDEIHAELAVHERVEDEVFFPAVKDELRKDKILKEAQADQSKADDAIQALSELKPGETGYDEKVGELGKKIAAHAKEEERDVFPRVRESDIDTEELGASMEAHKAALQAENRK